MKKYIFILLLLISLSVKGQPKQKVTDADYKNNQVEMADKLREGGKIYVVVAILVTILAGFIVYVIRIDSKVSKLEKEIKNKQL